MRVFIVACLVATMIAVGAAAVLDHFVQESSSTAFTEPSAEFSVTTREVIADSLQIFRWLAMRPALVVQC